MSSWPVNKGPAPLSYRPNASLRTLHQVFMHITNVKPGLWKFLTNRHRATFSLAFTLRSPNAFRSNQPKENPPASEMTETQPASGWERKDYRQMGGQRTPLEPDSLPPTKAVGTGFVGTFQKSVVIRDHRTHPSGATG